MQSYKSNFGQVNTSNCWSCLLLI